MAYTCDSLFWKPKTEFYEYLHLYVYDNSRIYVDMGDCARKEASLGCDCYACDQVTYCGATLTLTEAKELRDALNKVIEMVER